MIVPDFWAEARKQHKGPGKQVTVRRYGWSVTSEADAMAMAEARVEAALQQILAGQKKPRREPKVPYNGAEGVPIREEVVLRQDEQVVTRNSYGARCLNSPNVLIADIDFEPGLPWQQILITYGCLNVISVVLGFVFRTPGIVLAGFVVALFVAAPVAHLFRKLAIGIAGGLERVARRRIERFVDRHRDWNLRLYRTHAGFRILVTHQLFDPLDPVTLDFFRAVGTDPLYVRMCRNQRCFRARLTAKPWRMGMMTHLRPRPGVWPVRPERMADRQRWIDEYEQQSLRFAACRFVESLGSGSVHPGIWRVVELHDKECHALVAEKDLA